MSRHVLGLWPSSGATSSTFSPSKDQQAREAAAQIARDRVVRQPDRDRRGPEDALAPVVPVAGRPLAEHGLVVARPPAPDPELGEVARERWEEPRPAGLDAAALRRAVGDRALADLLPPQWEGLGLRPRARVREHAHQRGVAVAVELGASGVAAAALVSTRRRVEHLAADQLDVVGRDRPRLASALLLGLCDQRDRVALDLLVALGALEDRAEDRQRLDDRRVADALLAQPRHPRLDWTRAQVAELMAAPLRDDAEVELDAVVRATLIAEVHLSVVGPPHVVDVVAQRDCSARFLVEEVQLAGRLEVLDLAVELLGGGRRRKTARVMHAGVLPAHLVRQAVPAARPLDAHEVLCRRASSRNDGRGSEPPRRAGAARVARASAGAPGARGGVVDTTL